MEAKKKTMGNRRISLQQPIKIIFIAPFPIFRRIFFHR